MATEVQQTIFELEKELNVVKTIAETLEKTMENFKKCPKARITRSYIETRLQCLEKHWDTYNQAYNEIIRNLPKGKKGQIPYIENEEFFKHEEMYIDLKTKFMDSLTPKELSPGSSVPFITSDSQEARVMLPKILLPTYSGQHEDWSSFHDLFLTLVHNNKSLNNVQKLHYLKTSLIGEAALILKHIQITESNYEKAWDSLMKRFGNKRITINAIMRRLFSQRKITSNSSSLIKNLLDTTFECLHHFNNLNVKTENWDTLIIFMIVQKLDSETHKDWEEHVSNKLDNPDSLPSLDMLQQFLQSRFRTLELTETPKHRPSVIISKERSYHVTSNIEYKKCQICNENHTLSHCKKFANFTPVQRSEHIKTNHRCYNCLASGHSVKQCRIPVCCRLCKKRHHTLLHENKENNTTHVEHKPLNKPALVLNTNVDNIEEDDQDITMVASHISTKQNPTALLATALVQVKTDENYTITLRALIDQGSQASFISERAAQLLKAKRYPIKGTVVGVGSSMMDIKHVVYINVQPKSEACNLNIKTYVMSKQLTTKLPSQTITYNNWPHLQGLILADPNYYNPSQIDLLLGVEVYASIIQNEIIKGSPGSPCAQKHQGVYLGWILFGTIGSRSSEDTVVVMHYQFVAEDFLKTLWEVDQDTKRKYTKEEQKCETFYENSYKRDSNGRYIVRLPFRSNDLTITEVNTREISLKRLLLQEKGLLRIPDLQEKYDEVLREYLTMGHMEEVPEDEIHNSSVYLPHHAVIRNDKETTKLRVVFDASSKNNNGVSLNDTLLIGPGLQDDMRSIIMRWRMHKVCFASDITKMYRMVLIDKQDTDYHRILWRDNTKTSTDTLHSDNFNELTGIKDYRLKTVNFGTACAPYLAIKTLTKLADEEGECYTEAAKIIREDFYVDDLASGCDTTEQAICISNQIIKILKRGGFQLQKWASNDKEFLKSLDATTVTAKANLDLKLDGIIKALGLTWNLGEDEFRYQLQLEPVSENITKRTILSDLQRLFDPLGWIAPAIVTAKMLVQRLWLEGVGWDQEIETQLRNEWKCIRKDLQNNVNDIRIKRWLNTFNSEKERISLHGFCDASLKAYAAVIYCRIYTSGGEVKTHIVAARTKVAPVKPVSLPRLELCGAVLLAKLIHKVSQAMRIPAHNVFAWTDSTIVLAWLLGEPSRWKPFVANRVVEILEQTSNSQWFHVQSSQNPADIASRGSSISQLICNTLWWNGPTWLATTNIKFTRPAMLSTEIEQKLKIQSHVNVIEHDENHVKFGEYDSLVHLLRVIVHCKRFLNMKKTPQNLEMHITANEIQEAMDICIRRVQGEEYFDEINRIKENKAVKITSTLKTLNPILDERNILRVGGRLRNADVDENLKHPIILGKRNGLVPLVLIDAHKKTMHGGINLMTTYLMSKYWIVSCKNLVKQCIQKCLTCARQRATSRQQIMGDLPISRVTPARPFSRSGVDFAGPIHILNSKGRGAKTSKAYICIFICMAVKAIHLELVSDLIASAFIAAFKRFVSRRGRCSEIWSDNGTNFVASNKELFAMWKEAGFDMPGHIIDYLVNNGTQWHFSPPYSPNFGGLWEAGVKSVKQHLRKTLTSNLTFEEFATVLTQIEACLNSRPLTPVNTNVDLIEDIQVLTPGHFLIGEPLINVPDRDYTTQNINLLTRWQHTQRMVLQFWTRWQTEFLSRLNQRPKWLKETREFEVGDIVLLKDQMMLPTKWALAQIVEKHPGVDKITRVYTVRYNGKVTKRSVSGLCALPIKSRNED